MKLAIQNLSSSSNSETSKQKVLKYLRIVSNGALHLQNVIQDALDLARIEYNKFTVEMERFDIRLLFSEVYDLMKF